jgi:hypothetical protein
MLVAEFLMLIAGILILDKLDYHAIKHPHRF